jgi:hypothetical protein
MERREAARLQFYENSGNEWSARSVRAGEEAPREAVEQSAAMR